MDKEKVEKLNGIVNMQISKAHESCERVSRDVGREYQRNDEEKIIEEIFKILEQRGRIEPPELKRHIRGKISEGVNYIIQNTGKIERRDSETVEAIVTKRLYELARDIQSGKEVDLELEARRFAITQSALGDLQEQVEKGVRYTDYRGNEVNSGYGSNDAKKEIFSTFNRVSMDLAKCGIRLSSADEKRIEKILDDLATKMGELTFQSRSQKISFMEDIVKEVPNIVNSELGKIQPEETGKKKNILTPVLDIDLDAPTSETVAVPAPEEVISEKPAPEEPVPEEVAPEEVVPEESGAEEPAPEEVVPKEPAVEKAPSEEPTRLEDMPGYVDPEKAAHEAFEAALRAALEEMGEWPPRASSPVQEAPAQEVPTQETLVPEELVLEAINVQENVVSRTAPEGLADATKTRRRVDYEQKIKDIRSDTRTNEARLNDDVEQRLSRMKKQIMSVVGTLVTTRRNGLGGKIQRQVKDVEDKIAEACARLENQVKNTSTGYRTGLSDRAVRGVNEIEQNSEDTSRMSDELRQDERRRVLKKTRYGVEETSQEAQDRKSRSTFVTSFSMAMEQITKAINQYVSTIGVINLNIRPGELDRISREFHQVMQSSIDDVVSMHNGSMKALTQKLQDRITELEHDINRSEGVVEQEDDKRGLFSTRDIGYATLDAQSNTTDKRKEEARVGKVKRLESNLII